MDRPTRWPEAVPISDTSACAVVEAFLQTWVARFGVPSTLTSDRGPQFASALWAELCRLLGVDHVQTTTFHLQSNGLLERFHRRLKDALCAQATSPSWVTQLPLIMLFLQATPREDVQAPKLFPIDSLDIQEMGQGDFTGLFCSIYSPEQFNLF